MAKLQNFSGKLCESEYEEAFLSYLQEEGWTYCAGKEVFPWRQKSISFMEQKRQGGIAGNSQMHVFVPHFFCRTVF